MKKISLIACALSLLLMMLAGTAYSQQTDTLLLQQMLESHPDLFNAILKHPAKHEVQILYTQIDRDQRNGIHFHSYSYRLNARHYFYPASTVKLPTVIFALEKMNRLQIPGLTVDTDMLTDSSFEGETTRWSDSTAANGKPSLGQYIRKILLVSDNDAYNRLYEFVGRAELNAKLKKDGLTGTRIISRLAIGDSGVHARHTNQIRFVRDSQLVYLKPTAVDTADYPMFLENFKQGKAYLNDKNQLIPEPFDFSTKNVYPLADQQEVLKRLIFPDQYDSLHRFALTAGQYRFIYRYMSMYPTESSSPAYGPPAFYPAYCKFLLYGSDTNAVMDPNIRIFNKIGDAYGYNIDNAYIVDFNNKVEFLLTAVVQSNEDGIVNDEKYEYATVTLPFMKNLGRMIYEYELKRKRYYLPDLSRYQFSYLK